MTFLTVKENRGYVAMSNKFNNVQFFRKIEPGERLDLEANIDSFRHGIAKGRVEGKVSGALACSLEATIIVPDIFNEFQKRLPKKKSPEINLEITPLVDVIFLLLIFFVLSTQFIDLKTMSIELPTIDKETMSNLPEKRVKIEISKEGEVLINNTILDNFSIKTLNKELKAISPEIKTAIISADSDTKYQYLVTIMESLNRNGFKNIQINGVSQGN